MAHRSIHFNRGDIREIHLRCLHCKKRRIVAHTDGLRNKYNFEENIPSECPSCEAPWDGADEWFAIQFLAGNTGPINVEATFVTDYPALRRT